AATRRRGRRRRRSRDRGDDRGVIEERSWRGRAAAIAIGSACPAARERRSLFFRSGRSPGAGGRSIRLPPAKRAAREQAQNARRRARARNRGASRPSWACGDRIMPAAHIERIETLARQFRKNERNLTLYFPDFGTPPPHGNLNRVFGPPVGITADDWPTYAPLGELLHEADCLDVWDPCDARMEHVFTIDLAGVELLGAPRGARA